MSPMPLGDIELEWAGNEVGTGLEVVPNKEFEISIENLTSIDSLPASMESVETIVADSFVVQLPEGSHILNRGGITGMMLLDAGAPVPEGTPPDTVILRKS